MKAGHQLALGLGQIKRGPLATGHGAGEIRPKGPERERIVENIPLPDAALLLEDDGIEVHAAGHDHRHQDAQRHGDFIAHHLRRLAHAAEQRPLASRAIADQDNAEDLRRQDGEHVEKRDVHFLSDDAVAEGQSQIGHERAGEGDVGAEAEEHVIGGIGNDVFLDEELHAVGEGLQPAELAPHARRPQAVLDAAGDLALHPHRKNGRDQHETD